MVKIKDKHVYLKILIEVPYDSAKAGMSAFPLDNS